MRFNLIVFFILIYSGIAAQDLNNTEWIMIKAVRKDGSRIVGKGTKEKDNLQYYFTGDSVYTAANGEYGYHQKCSLINNQLFIGELIHYQIDSLNEVFLGVTEIPKEPEPDDKISSFVFIKSDYIYDYLIKTNQFKLSADSLVEHNNRFQPEYNGHIADLFGNTDLIYSMKEEMSGSLIISGNGIVQKVEIHHKGKPNDPEIKRVTDILKSTTGHWIIPPSPKVFLFKSYFILDYSYEYSGSQVFFSFVHPDSTIRQEVISLKGNTQLDIQFNNGIRLFNKNKFDKAAEVFSVCLKIDPEFTDAYYNLGYSYKQMGNSEKACEVWEKLKDMGQKEGERLYNNECK